MSHSAPVVQSTVRLWRNFGGKILRYATGSVVAAVASEAVFLLMFGGLHASPVWSTALGWLAGAVPNFWLNRTWTWRVGGRPRFRDEVLPYVVIIVVTLVAATVATSEVDQRLAGSHLGHAAQTVLVSGAFLSVYGAMFLLRFFLLERLFGGQLRPAPDPEPTQIPAAP
ncbi:MAG: GtrA family protein [Nocardioidaceae bacterium]